MPTVLIIDSDLEDRDKIEQIMLEQSWNIKKATNDQEARMYLRNKFDLVIMNNFIPTKYNGRDFVEKFRSEYKDIYIIIVSPDHSRVVINDLLSLGINDYMVKPIDKAILLWKLSLQFNSISRKEFAKVNIPSDSKAGQCFFDIKGAIAGIGEQYIDVFFKHHITVNTEMKMDPAFFNELGCKKSSIDIKINEIKELENPVENYHYLARCALLNLEDSTVEKNIEWLIENQEQGEGPMSDSTGLYVDFIKKGIRKCAFKAEGVITEITESGFKMNSGVELSYRKISKLKSRIFMNIGFEPLYSLLIPRKEGIIKYCQGSFIGITERDATRIRAWINRKLTVKDN